MDIVHRDGEVFRSALGACEASEEGGALAADGGIRAKALGEGFEVKPSAVIMTAIAIDRQPMIVVDAILDCSDDGWFHGPES